MKALFPDNGSEVEPLESHESELLNSAKL